MTLNWFQRWPGLVFWIALTLAVGFAGSQVTLQNIPGWYAGLAKPWFTPPNGLFGPVWTVLYVAMAVAVWRVGRTAGTGRSRAVGLFAIQLALNAAWPMVFFGLRAPAAALAVIVALLAVLVPTIGAFVRADRVAGWLLIPYLAWTCFATLLNAAIVALN